MEKQFFNAYRFGIDAKHQRTMVKQESTQQVCMKMQVLYGGTVTPHTLGRIERGVVSKPHSNTIRLISRYFALDLDEYWID